MKTTLYIVQQLNEFKSGDNGFNDAGEKNWSFDNWAEAKDFFKRVIRNFRTERPSSNWLKGWAILDAGGEWHIGETSEHLDSFALSEIRKPY